MKLHIFENSRLLRTVGLAFASGSSNNSAVRILQEQQIEKFIVWVKPMIYLPGVTLASMVFLFKLFHITLNWSTVNFRAPLKSWCVKTDGVMRLKESRGISYVPTPWKHSVEFSFLHSIFGSAVNWRLWNFRHTFRKTDVQFLITIPGAIAASVHSTCGTSVHDSITFTSGFNTCIVLQTSTSFVLQRPRVFSKLVS